MRNTIISCLIMGFTMFVLCAEGRDATPEEFAAYHAQVKHRETIAAKDGYELEALALDTNAPFLDRDIAIETLAKEPAAHVGALQRLISDQSQRLSLRYAAIEAIEPARPDIAIQGIHVLLQEVARIPIEQPTMDYSVALRASGLLARLGDGTGLPFIVSNMVHSSRNIDQNCAIGALSSFFYMKDLKPHVPLVSFIDRKLKRLDGEDEKNRGKEERLLIYAVSTLYGLHAVETIPDFHRWLADPRAAPVRDALEANLRWLEALKAELDQGKPDQRDAIKINPGVDPAWKLPTARRD